MKLSFRVSELWVEDAVNMDARLNIRIKLETDGLYAIVRPLRASPGHKNLVKVGAGYEWAYQPGEYVRGTIEECEAVLRDMYEGRPEECSHCSGDGYTLGQVAFRDDKPPSGGCKHCGGTGKN
jgi:hypothetical protein